MGQTARTTKLLLDLSARDQGGANAGKRSHLEATAKMLDAARQFYLDFFLAHPEKPMERVEVLSKKTGEVRERLLSADKLLTWAEFHTVATTEHPDPLPQWNFSQAFPDFPHRYRRSVILASSRLPFIACKARRSKPARSWKASVILTWSRLRSI